MQAGLLQQKEGTFQSTGGVRLALNVPWRRMPGEPQAIQAENLCLGTGGREYPELADSKDVSMKSMADNQPRRFYRTLQPFRRWRNRRQFTSERIRCRRGVAVTLVRKAAMRTLRPYVPIVVCAVVLLTDCSKYKVPLTARDAPILLFDGTGASPNDVAAIEALLNKNQLKYSTANSSQLNGMSTSQLSHYRLLIVPGGNFIEIGRGLTPAATANIRNAVQNGVNYLGVCGGAFFASTYSGYNGLNLTSGVRFAFYSAEEKGIRKASVPITVVDGPTLEHYWEDGPQLSGWGVAVGKYPDGTPAIAEGRFGEGWVVLSGVHPEAPANWRKGMSFTSSADLDNAYAETLIHAALNGKSLPHY